MATTIPFAHGVPAASGPPAWWDAAPGPGGFNARVDDPRWVGATSITYPGAAGSASGETAVFRALHHDTAFGAPALYLSWWVKSNPSVDNALDRVYLGLWHEVGPGTPLGIKVEVFDAGSPAPISDWVRRDAAKIVAVTHDGANWGAESPPPTWAADASAAAPGHTRVWTRTGQFAVAIRVPLLAAGDFSDAGINLGALGSDFRLWFMIQRGVASSVNQFFWPRVSSLPAAKPPAPSTFEIFTALDSPGSVGVKLTWDHVHSTNTPNHEIQLSSTPPHPTNTLVAEPENLTGGDILAGNLQARFRIANWGSQAADWNAVPNLDTLWQLVPGDGGSNPAANAATIPNGTLGSCSFNWTLDTPAELTPFTLPASDPNSRRRHQCMLVELEGPGLQFINSSVYRNMDQVGASEFTREADISVEGLESLGDPERIVYLYLQTTNMPATIDDPGPQVPEPKDDGAFERRRAAAIQAGRDTEQDSGTAMDHIADELPTYRIHVFHETGETSEQDGNTYPVLAQQSSFGYVVSHSGPLYGWTPELTGPGLTKIGPDLYRLDVPTDGRVQVTTSITAHETPPKDRTGCWGGVLDLVDRIFRR